MIATQQVENTDIKMSMFFNHGLWTDTIQKCIDKGISKGLLTQLCETQNRLAFAQLIENGQYKVAPPYIGLIPKPNSCDFRKVYINTDMDRFVLSLINEVYMKIYGHLIHPKCVSYQKGIGVNKIIRELSLHTFISHPLSSKLGYKVDVSKYFDSVNKKTLFKALNELNTNSPIDKIIYDYYSEDLIINEKGEVEEKYKSLAQGCAVSAFLANYILKDIDEALSSLDILYYRYSDDILILGTDSDIALDMLEHMLEDKGLALNPKKIEAVYKDEWFTFLGFKINGKKITFSEDSVKRFKSKIKKITKMRKGMHTKSRKVQQRAIKDINYYLYTAFLKSNLNFGWAEYMFATVNQKDDVRVLDEYIKDHLKHMYTGKWNHTTNRNKTSNEQLAKMGYVSMVHMYNLYKINKEVFRAEVRRLMM